MPDATLYKHHDAVRDLYLDWSNYAEFAEVPPQSIATATVTSAAGISFSSVTVDGLVTFWTCSGGTKGKSYATEVAVVTSANKTLAADVVIVVY